MAILLIHSAISHCIEWTSGRIAELDDIVLWSGVWAKDRLWWFVRFSSVILASHGLRWYGFWIPNSSQVFIGTWNNTQVALKVLATDTGLTSSSMVRYYSFHFGDEILMSRMQAIRQEIEVRNPSSRFGYHIEISSRRHGQCWGIPTSYVRFLP